MLDHKKYDDSLLNGAAATLTATYNDLDSVRELFQKFKGEVAGVILEPVVGNSGYIEPTREFLQVGPQTPFCPCDPVAIEYTSSLIRVALLDGRVKPSPPSERISCMLRSVVTLSRTRKAVAEGWEI